MITAEVLSVGDELLIGQVINTNQAFIAERLNELGIFVQRMTTVGDVREQLFSALNEAVTRSEVVTITGGLGPTHDDITRGVVCEFFRRALILDTKTLERNRELFTKRRLPFTERNADQAMVPEGCTVMPNYLGTAPGFFFIENGKYVAVMPGVPFEMKAMVDSFLMDELRKRLPLSVISHRTLRTTGIAESFLADRLGDIQTLLCDDPDATLAFLPSPTGVRLRISVRKSDSEDAQKLMNEIAGRIRAKAGQYVYAEDDREIEDVLLQMFKERGWTLSVAESCTGGLITDRLTNVPGSSQYFLAGVVTYSNESKRRVLGVSNEILHRHGAVSEQTAIAMANGMRASIGSHMAVSTTGIAGPDGGSPEKPVGTVWIGLSTNLRTFALKFTFSGNRRLIKERAAQAALELMRRELMRKSP